MNPPRLRRPNIDAVQLIHGRRLAFNDLRELGAGFDQVLSNFRPQILVDLNDLKLDLGDLAFGLGDHPGKLASLTFQSRTVALKRSKPPNWHEVLLPQGPHALQLLKDEVDLLLLGLDLSGVALDFIIELGLPLFELRLLPGPRPSAEIEQRLLGGDNTTGLGTAVLCTVK